MTRVPVEYTTAAVKVYLAECIQKAGSQGYTNYSELSDPLQRLSKIQVAISLFT